MTTNWGSSRTRFNAMLAQVYERDQALRAKGDALSREVEERKAVEARFRLTVETALDAVVTRDPSDHYRLEPAGRNGVRLESREAIGRSLR